MFLFIFKKGFTRTGITCITIKCEAPKETEMFWWKNDALNINIRKDVGRYYVDVIMVTNTIRRKVMIRTYGYFSKWYSEVFLCVVEPVWTL